MHEQLTRRQTRTIPPPGGGGRKRPTADRAIRLAAVFFLPRRQKGGGRREKKGEMKEESGKRKRIRLKKGRREEGKKRSKKKPSERGPRQAATPGLAEDRAAATTGSMGSSMRASTPEGSRLRKVSEPPKRESAPRVSFTPMPGPAGLKGSHPGSKIVGVRFLDEEGASIKPAKK